MKQNPLLRFLTLCAFGIAASIGQALAAPVAVTNHSFEDPALALGGWNNSFAGWPGRHANTGSGNGDSFVEFIAGFSADANQHLGSQNGTYFYQDSGVAIAPWSRYILTVGLGNRNGGNGTTGMGLTNTTPPSDNSTDLATLLTTDAVLGANSLQEDIDTTGVPASTFVDRQVVWDTDATPPAGTVHIVIGDADGGGRSHFDNVRLDAVYLPLDDDSDGLPKGYEVLYNLDDNDSTGDNGATGDPDLDNLDNTAELALGTDPKKADTDGDGANDDIDEFPLDPTESGDSDGDGVGNSSDNCLNDPNPGQENADGDAEGDVCDADDDNDGVSDVDEGTNGTDPLDPDSDDDGLGDGAEDNSGNFVDVNNAGSDPNNSDTDGNGIDDFTEASNGFDPSDPADPGAVPDAFGWNYVSSRAAGAALLPNEVAGILQLPLNYLQDNWNSTDPDPSPNAGSELDLDHDADGVPEGFLKDTNGVNLTYNYGTTVSWASDTNWNTNNGVGDPLSKLMNGYADNTNATNDRIPVANIPYASYDVVVYVGSDGNGRTGALALLDAAEAELAVFSFSTDSAKGGFSTANFTVADGSANPPANTIVFPGRTESSIIIEHRRGSSNSGLHGFQIVSTSGPIPDNSDGDILPDGWENRILGDTSTGPLDDPNNNGFTNLEDFAYGLDAGTPGVVPPIDVTGGVLTNGAPATLVESVPSGVDFGLVHPRRMDFEVYGLTYTVCFSHDLATWFPSSDPGTVVARGAGVEAVKVQYPFFLPNGRKARFWKIIVSTTP